MALVNDSTKNPNVDYDHPSYEIYEKVNKKPSDFFRNKDVSAQHGIITGETKLAKALYEQRLFELGDSETDHSSEVKTLEGNLKSALQRNGQQQGPAVVSTFIGIFSMLLDRQLGKGPDKPAK